MIWPTNTRGSFPIVLGSTDFKTPLTGITTSFGTLKLCRPEYPGSTLRTKALTTGSLIELGQGLYKIPLSNVELGSAPGKFLYSFYTKKGLPYYGLINLYPHDLLFIGTIQGSVNALKKATTGTFSYANIALISNLGTHLQTRVPGSVGLATTLTQLGTHLQSRIVGSVKRSIEGTFSYANIALIPGIGTHLQSRIPGSVKQANTGTISYANIALISELGTHLQSRVPGSVGLATTLTQLGTHLNVRISGSPANATVLGTHLNSRIPGTVKRSIEGTISYANIALIANLGTHLNVRVTGTVADTSTLGTHLNSRIPGTVKRSINGTFSYSNIALLSELGTHLQSRITGSVADATTLGTHLNSRIPGSVATKGDMGSVKGAGFATASDSLKQIRDNISGGSAPSYIGSILWSKNPDNFTADNTFGLRMKKMLERVNSGFGVAVSAQVFTDKDKQTLFGWIDELSKRLKSIEVVVTRVSTEGKDGINKVIVDLKTTQTKLQESLQNYTKQDFSNKENIKEHLNTIIESLIDMISIKKQIRSIQDSVTTLSEELNENLQDLGDKKIKGAISQSGAELKLLLSQSINIASDISEKVNSNIMLLEEQRKNMKITDKVILSLVPSEKLKILLEELNGQDVSS